MYRKNLGDMLVAANLIDEVQMQIALAGQKDTGKRFGSTLVDLKFIDENVLWDVISELDRVDLDDRLAKIEQSLDRMWTLLEKVLRTLEIRA